MCVVVSRGAIILSRNMVLNDEGLAFGPAIDGEQGCATIDDAAVDRGE
jgi:hypothetical protein